MTILKTIKLGEYSVSVNDLSEVIGWLKERIDSLQTTTIVTLNPEIYLKSLTSVEHNNALKQADLVVADGAGIVWASEYCHTNKGENWLLRLLISLKNLLASNQSVARPKRITGVDLSLSLCQAGFLPIKIFGSQNSSAIKAKNNLLKMFPNLSVDTYDEVVLKDDYSLNDQEKSFLFSDKKCIILLALGAPKQEILMEKIKTHVAPGSVLVGVGGTVDFIAGNVKRAPKIMRRFGFEWLFRLIQEPKRLKRIINAVIIFPLTFIKNN